MSLTVLKLCEPSIYSCNNKLVYLGLFQSLLSLFSTPLHGEQHHCTSLSLVHTTSE
jgi:hypothetical protein